MSQEPFTETETEASLRRIAEGCRALHAAEAYQRKAAHDLAVAKEESKKANAHAARTRADGSPAPAAAPGPIPMPSPGDPSSTPLAFVLGVPLAAVRALGERSIVTVGDLATFTTGGGKLWEVPGIGEALASKVVEALADFWASRRPPPDEAA